MYEVEESAVELFAEVIDISDNALCLSDGAVYGWVPRSCVREDEEYIVGKAYVLTVPAWLCDNKGFTYNE